MRLENSTSSSMTFPAIVRGFPSYDPIVSPMAGRLLGHQSSSWSKLMGCTRWTQKASWLFVRREESVTRNGIIELNGTLNGRNHRKIEREHIYNIYIYIYIIHIYIYYMGKSTINGALVRWENHRTIAGRFSPWIWLVGRVKIGGFAINFWVIASCVWLGTLRKGLCWSSWVFVEKPSDIESLQASNWTCC